MFKNQVFRVNFGKNPYNLYKVYPIIPPITFNVISSISKVLPILSCVNSITDEKNIIKNAGIIIFLGLI